MFSRQGQVVCQNGMMTSFKVSTDDKSTDRTLKPFDDVMEVRGEDILTFNVGGVRFETLRKTLEGRANVRTKLANSAFRQRYYVKDRLEYFFDRDPDMFKATLNYLRTGCLHLPSYICGPAAKVELEFWGVPQKKIEQCCWINYNEWNSTQEALKRLEHDRKVNVLSRDSTHDQNATFWQRWRPEVWRLMNRSNSSIGAYIFGIVSLLFVLVAIFSFLAETTEPFDYYTIKTTQQPLMNATSMNNMTSDYNATLDKHATNATSSAANGTTSNKTKADDTTGIEFIDVETKVRTKHPTLQAIDFICLSYFVLEYVTRLIFSPKKLKHATSLLSVIDLLAILPDVIEFVIYYARPDLKQNVDAVGYITIIRIIRVLRIFRLVRHSAGLWVLVYTLRASFSELVMLFWFMGLGVLVFSSLIYYVDDKEYFKSIPNGFWWALITMTTVGYGDMVPQTTQGKLVGSLTAMTGVLMIGFTVPALVNNFMLYYRHVQFAMHLDEVEKMNDESDDNTNTDNDIYCDVIHDNPTNGKHESSPLFSESDL